MLYSWVAFLVPIHPRTLYNHYYYFIYFLKGGNEVHSFPLSISLRNESGQKTLPRCCLRLADESIH